MKFALNTNVLVTPSKETTEYFQLHGSPFLATVIDYTKSGEYIVQDQETDTFTVSEAELSLVVE